MTDNCKGFTFSYHVEPLSGDIDVDDAVAFQDSVVGMIEQANWHTVGGMWIIYPHQQAPIEMSAEWTTETPTRYGLYWCWSEEQICVRYVEVSIAMDWQRLKGIKEGDAYIDVPDEYPQPARTYATHWQGPLPEPAPPVADEVTKET